MMQDVVAPKDPEKKRPYFYIMRDKEIFGSRQEDGRGIQYLYQDAGRLINSAQIVGNIEDSEMLKLMETVEGFRKLVHSIGVSVETEDSKEQVEFIFQMYGKKDLYGGGANLTAVFPGDGAEKRIYLADVDWQEDDHEPGQIKILMDTPEKLAKASVRLYLNDGYTAPEVSEEQQVDVNGVPYQNMIKRSLIQTGNTFRIYRAIRRARLGEDGLYWRIDHTGRGSNTDQHGVLCV